MLSHTIEMEDSNSFVFKVLDQALSVSPLHMWTEWCILFCMISSEISTGYVRVLCEAFPPCLCKKSCCVEISVEFGGELISLQVILHIQQYNWTVQKRRNSIASAMELRRFCPDQSQDSYVLLEIGSYGTFILLKIIETIFY